MPLNGEFKPSRNDRTRKQVELYEATNGLAGGTFDDKPVIILTYMGAKSGKIRKTPLMRVERDGTYAVAASYAGAATHPFVVRQHRRQSDRRIAGWRGQARAAGSRSLRPGKSRMVEAHGRRLL